MIPTVQQATILSGASLSNELDLQGAEWLGFELPANIDGATSITFATAAEQGGNAGVFQKLVDSAGAEVTMTVAAGENVSPTSGLVALLAPWRYLKVRLGTSGSPVVASADRVINVALKSPS